MDDVFYILDFQFQLQDVRQEIDNSGKNAEKKIKIFQ